MRIPFTKYGWPQVVIFPVVLLLAMILFPIGTVGFLDFRIIIAVEIVLFVVLIWALMFFRDPHRVCSTDEEVLFAPADGKITDIEQIEKDEFIGQPALRIGIFLSIFNVHINRAPCDVKVETITYKEGQFRNAMNPESGRVNESNTLGLVRTNPPKDKLIVRQISGAIARRIVCDTAEGRELSGGQKFGMLKFGSRTELYVPVREEMKCLVQIGDKVKAGLTPMVKYEEKSNVKV
ncbi:MAG: phosphatidylserine decarboxylase family protein [Sedimentisphaerales bacterium]|nr:phosphatidylserine decarboxylase family protein [Sedimentisphaerales bacterium]